MMQQLYRITPLEKKNVEYFVDVFQRMPNGTIRGFDVTEIWRWGHGYREEDEPVQDWEVGSNGVHCRPQIGLGCELDDLCGVHVNFSDGFTDQEKAEIEALLRWEAEDEDGRCGTGWIYDGDHEWEIEDEHVRITGPIKIDLVDQQGEILEEHVGPTIRMHDHSHKITSD